MVVSSENSSNTLKKNENIISKESHTVHSKLKSIDSTVVKSIIEYYKIKYGSKAQLELMRSDSFIELSISSIPISNEDYDGVLISATFSLIIDSRISNSNFTGDINGDKVDDLIVTASTEGGGGGGNVYWDDIFVFIRRNGIYWLDHVVANTNIACKKGFFNIKAIKNNVIEGESNCYEDSDPNCCPSLVYKTNLVYVNSEFKIAINRQLR